MITVTINRNKKGHIYSFTVSGHANSGPYGHDLVCAGVSAVTFGAVNAILSLCEKNLTIEKAEAKGGYLRVDIPFTKEEKYRENVQLLLEGMIVSLQTIERDYREHIQISEMTEV